MRLIYTTQVQAQFYSQVASYKMETYTTIDGVECVSWTDEHGTHSMTKIAYDEQQAAINDLS
jgi:hypothetical protein